MDIVFRRVPHSRDVLFVEIQQRGCTVRAGTEVELSNERVAIRLGLKSVVAAWFAGRSARRAKRRDHRELGVCPDCGIYDGAHKSFGHGVSRWL